VKPLPDSSDLEAQENIAETRNETRFVRDSNDDGSSTISLATPSSDSLRKSASDNHIVTTFTPNDMKVTSITSINEGLDEEDGEEGGDTTSRDYLK